MLVLDGQKRMRIGVFWRMLQSNVLKSGLSTADAVRIFIRGKFHWE